MMQTDGAESPQYEHDCDHCISLGRSYCSTYYSGNLSVDLYVHVRESQWHDLVIRFGNRDYEYWALVVKEPEGFQTVPINAMFREVWERAISAGAVSTEAKEEPPIEASQGDMR